MKKTPERVFFYTITITTKYLTKIFIVLFFIKKEGKMENYEKQIHSNIIGRVKNHAGYVKEEDEYSTNPDDLYITNEKEFGLDEDMVRVDKNEVVVSYVKKLKMVQTRLKTEKNPKEKRKLEKIIENIKTGLFLERDFIERSKKQKFAEFMATLSK